SGRRHAAPRPYRGRVRRDRRGRDGGRAAPPARAGRRGPRRRDSAAQHRRRAQDARRAGRPRGPDRHDPALAPRFPAGGTAVSVTVRVPTILRTYTAGAAEVAVDGATLAEVVAA